MEIEKLFKDLDSNQSLECEEAKKKLMDLFSQTKEAWLVHGLMEYFFHTGSIRIMEVLVKVQSPHDNYLFDKLSECLKSSKYRSQALELFGFVVRKHPTWLHKVKDHKFIKDILKLLQTEKEIVLLISALLCIVTLLPIIPMIKTSFLNELFDVFGHLASWNSENPNKLSEGKLAHMQLGLELLFHRLYGMYPCNFLSYLSEFAKKDQGAIFKHTIKPLLESVRVHPMLVTANAEKEMNSARWKCMEAHDVVLECAKLSVTNQELHTDYAPCQDTPISAVLTQPIDSWNPLIYSDIAFPFQSVTDREQLSEFKKGDTIWSPHTEIASMTSTMPHTPTPSYGVPMSSSSSTGPMSAIMGVTGSSPPEAAVEATPETTPMKELTMKPSTNPHAVCAIFTTSQPASPMRRDPGSQFTFPESPGPSSNQQIFVDHTTINKIPTKSFDQKLQHVLNDRHQIRMQACQKSTLSPNNGTPTFDSHAISQEDEEVRDLTSSVDVYTKDAGKIVCDVPKRRLKCGGIEGSGNSRFGSARINVSGYKKPNFSDEINGFAGDRAKIRRSNSLPTICGSLPYSSTNSRMNQQGQQISKLSALSVRSGAFRKQLCTITSRETQTVHTWPQEYEYLLYFSISENNKCRSEHNVLYPQEILNQYVDRAVKLKDSGYRLDQEHFQLICLQLQFEQNRREIHAERIRRLMGRSRDIRSLEREQDRLKDNLKTYDEENRRLANQIESTTRQASEKERRLTDELNSIKARYQEEVEHNKILQSNNEDLQCRLNEEIQKRKDLTIEVDALRGQICDMQNELQYAQFQAELGVQCKQELVKLETEFLVMGEVQMKLRDRLAEVDNMRARDEEISHLQTSYTAEIKDLRRALDEKTSQFEIAKHKLVELQTQIVNNEKNVNDQKRLLNVVKDEYEEKLKALNKKYEAQKAVILQMEETLLYLYRNQTPVSVGACSPDTDRTDIASSMEKNSPLSTSLASCESFPASYRSVTQINNLQAYVETPNNATAPSGSSAAANIPLSPYHYS